LYDSRIIWVCMGAVNGAMPASLASSETFRAGSNTFK